MFYFRQSFDILSHRFPPQFCDGVELVIIIHPMFKVIQTQILCDFSVTKKVTKLELKHDLLQTKPQVFPLWD